MPNPTMLWQGSPGATRHNDEVDWDGGPVDVSILDIADAERATIAEVTVTHTRFDGSTIEASFEVSVAEAGHLISALAEIIADHGLTIGQNRERVRFIG